MYPSINLSIDIVRIRIDLGAMKEYFTFPKASAVLEYPIYPTPPLGQEMTQGQFFKRSLTGLNSEFFLLLD